MADGAKRACRLHPRGTRDSTTTTIRMPITKRRLPSDEQNAHVSDMIVLETRDLANCCAASLPIHPVEGCSAFRIASREQQQVALPSDAVDDAHNRLCDPILVKSRVAVTKLGP